MPKNITRRFIKLLRRNKAQVIHIKVEDVLGEYAKAINTTVDGLTDDDKRVALQMALINAGTKSMEAK